MHVKGKRPSASGGHYLLRFGSMAVLSWRAIGGGVATVGPGIENFMRIVCTMSHYQGIRLIGLIVGDDIQRKAGFRYAIIYDALFDIALNAFAGRWRRQNVWGGSYQ